MLEKFNGKITGGTPVFVFILRNLVLYALVFNAYLYFRNDLNIFFISCMFASAILAAIIMEKIRMRFIPAIISAALLAVIARVSIFFIIRVITPMDTGLDKDFFYLYFDKDFFPSLVPAFIVWIFNFSALRKPGFVYFEVGCNALFLLWIFYSQAHYNITLYHPTFFGIILGFYVFFEILILVFSFRDMNRHIQKIQVKKKKVSGSENRRRVLVYLWIIIPLVLLFILYLFLMDVYNKEASKGKGGLMESTLFRFDLSKYVKLQDEIKVTDELVMIMRKNGPALRLLIRRFVLSEYDPKGGFYQSQKKGIDDIPVIVPDNSTILPDPGYIERELVTQEYFFVNFDPTSLVALNYPVKIIPLKNWQDSSFLRIYKVESQVSQIELYDDLLVDAEGPGLPEDLFSFYTDYGNDEFIKEMAESITEYSTSYYEKVVDIRDYLQENYLYSLKPGIARDGNQLHHFLLQSKKGYCSYFAFAMALMCRSIGIPARVAVGFFVSPDMEVLNFYEVKAFQAHAWVEIYFEDLGWIEFDPTSSTIAPGEDLSFMFNFQMDEKLKRLLTEILENQHKLAEETKEPDEFLEQTRNISFLVIQLSGWLLKYWFLILPCLYGFIIIVIKTIYLFLYALSSHPRKKIKFLFLHSMGILYSLGILRKTDESLTEFADRIAVPPEQKTKKSIHCFPSFKPWLEVYLKAVFGNEFNDGDLISAQESYTHFIRELNRNVSLVKRVLGFLNPAHSFKRKT